MEMLFPNFKSTFPIITNRYVKRIHLILLGCWSLDEDTVSITCLTFVTWKVDGHLTTECSGPQGAKTHFLLMKSV